jgi:pyruvate/2-oxoglutarate dehydrogenase complex dihydrolipoamide acyltransferase (E2) component
VDIGDIMYQVTTYKATIGYESQEEGYIAKIFSQNGAVVLINGLIGIMVEEEENIANVYLTKITSEAEAPAV